MSVHLQGGNNYRIERLGPLTSLSTLSTQQYLLMMEFCFGSSKAQPHTARRCYVDLPDLAAYKNADRNTNAGALF